MQRRTFLTSTLVATSLTEALSNTESQPDVAPPAQPFVVKAGEGRFGEKTRLFGISPNDIKVSGKDTGDILSVFEYKGQGKGGPPLHIHLRQDEIFYVLEGNYLFEVGGKQHKLTTGELIFLPRNVPHTFAQLTDKGRLLLLLQPSGKMEDYFREVGRKTWPIDPQEGAKLFADHQMQVVGPPLAID